MKKYKLEFTGTKSELKKIWESLGRPKAIVNEDNSIDALTRSTFLPGNTYVYDGVSKKPEHCVRVEFKPGITSIKDFAFSRLTDVEEIILPDTVKSIGKGTFGNCLKLKTVHLPEGITEIPDSAFYCCESIEEINLPSTIKKIGPHAFENCYKLKTINIPEGVVEIGFRAFTDTALKSIDLPDSIERVSKGFTSEGPREIVVHSKKVKDIILKYDEFSASKVKMQ